MIDPPQGAAVRLHPRAAAWIVTIAPADGPFDPETLVTRPGHVSATLSHDAGLSWPDRRGEALASAVLAQPGGAALLIFESGADAIACHARLLREAVR